MKQALFQIPLRASPPSLSLILLFLCHAALPLGPLPALHPDQAFPQLGDFAFAVPSNWKAVPSAFTQPVPSQASQLIIKCPPRMPSRVSASHVGPCPHPPFFSTQDPADSPFVAVQGLQGRVVSELSESLCTYTYPLFVGFPSHLGHHRALSRVPCAK